MRERIINWPQIRDWWKVGEKSVERRSSSERSSGVEISICVFYYNVPHGIMGVLLPLEELHAFFSLSVIEHNWTMTFPPLKVNASSPVPNHTCDSEQL